MALRILFTILAIFASLGIIGFENYLVFGERSTGYLMAEDISAHITFNFRDGVETHEFPVFKTTDYLDNEGTFFQVQRDISKSPHLHKALDEAFKFNSKNSNADYNYKFFDIDVEFTNAIGEYDVHHLIYSEMGGKDKLLPENNEPRKTLHYINCQVDDYLVDTVYNAYRSYGQGTETGFAIIETIDFQCSGINSEVINQNELEKKTDSSIINEFPKLEYNYADNIRTFVTFEFDNGVERIEFPIFHLLSGFAEDDDPSFHVEGVVNKYPLLASAINNARNSLNSPGGVNIDFNANVEFVQETQEGEKVFRGIYYEDCRVTGSNFTTYYDNEEGYVDAGGYGMMQTIEFDCAGMNPSNPIYKKTMTVNELYRNYNTASGPRAIAEFRFDDNTVETINFPIFKQQTVLAQANAKFQLEGMVGEYPLLYKQVDDAAKINQIRGATQAHKLFDVDVNLQYDDKTVRGFLYEDCRIVNYLVTTQQQNEEGFWVGFALANTFDFECIGYEPNYSKNKTILDTSIDDRNTTWAGHSFEGYLQAEDVSANLTFNFRDKVETHEFPVFKTTADFAENKGTAFQVQGVVADTPHLHKALDEAFKYRTAKETGFDYNYKFFDIDAIVITSDESRKIFRYIDCQIDDYLIETLSHTHRGYLSTNTGFAIVETIDFECGGVHSDVTSQSDLTYRTEPGIINEFPKLEYNYADNIRTWITFGFENGMERIEFPIFKTTSGFGEGDEGASFHVEGIVNKYPLLASAIDNARDNQNMAVGTNVSFRVIAAFVQETPNVETPLRGIYYEDCNVNGSDILTYYDNEEPYATVGGFAVNHSIDFQCTQMIPLNPRYDVSSETNNQYNDYKMASGIHAVTEFRFHDNTVEIIDFPIFKQQQILSEEDTTFQLKGMVGDYPLLYKQVDEAARFNQIIGVIPYFDDLFEVDVNLKDGDETIRGFSYTDCRVIDYQVATGFNEGGLEESFFFWFALENTFEFECAGYHPNNPSYDEMFETKSKNSIKSSLDLKDTDSWGPGFKYTKK